MLVSKDGHLDGQITRGTGDQTIITTVGTKVLETYVWGQWTFQCNKAMSSREITCGNCAIKCGCNRPEYTSAGLYPVLKRPRLDYTLVSYGLGQFIPWGILWPRPIHASSKKYAPMISITICDPPRQK